MKTTINTVVAKAIVQQFQDELLEKVKSKNESLTNSLNESKEVKDYFSITNQIEELKKIRDTIESRIYKLSKGKFSVTRNYNSKKDISPFKAEISKPTIKDASLISEIILLGHEGKNVDQIKKIISAKFKV